MIGTHESLKSASRNIELRLYESAQAAQAAHAVTTWHKTQNITLLEGQHRQHKTHIELPKWCSLYLAASSLSKFIGSPGGSKLEKYTSHTIQRTSAKIGLIFLCVSIHSNVIMDPNHTVPFYFRGAQGAHPWPLSFLKHRGWLLEGTRRTPMNPIKPFLRPTLF